MVPYTVVLLSYFIVHNHSLKLAELFSRRGLCARYTSRTSFIQHEEPIDETIYERFNFKYNDILIVGTEQTIEMLEYL